MEREKSQRLQNPYRLYDCHRSTHHLQLVLQKLMARRQQTVSRTTSDQKKKSSNRTMGVVDVPKLALRILLIASGFGVFLATTWIK